VSRHVFEDRFFRIFRVLSILGFVVVTGFPLAYMLALSFKPISSLLRNPANPFPTLEEFSLISYLRVLTPLEQGGAGFLGFMYNSFVLSAATVVVVILLGVLGGYAAGRLKFPGRGGINFLIIVVYLFPGILIAVPMFIFLTQAGLRPSLTGAVIVYVAIALPLALFVLRNYLESIPEEIDDAARVDGASRLQLIRFITVPLAMPAIAAVAIYVFISIWDEFLFALLILVDRRDLWTVTLGIRQLSDLNGSPETVLMAGCVVITIPVVVAFAFAQRFLVDGLASGGVKE
jgi:multiple sugar transport system permease protein